MYHRLSITEKICQLKLIINGKETSARESRKMWKKKGPFEEMKEDYDITNVAAMS